MSRIPMIEPASAPPEVRTVYERFREDGFQIFNVMKMFGNNHHFVAGLYEFVRGLYVDAKLAPRYRELAYLRASQLNSCHY
jgi:alkylhydroperoxidase family enzyme